MTTHPTGPAGPWPGPAGPGRLTREAVANARLYPSGRVALALIRIGLAIASVGISELHRELRRHPLVEVTR